MFHSLFRLGLAAMLVAALAGAPAVAQRGGDHGERSPATNAPQPRAGDGQRSGPGLLSLLPADSTTEHVVQAGGRSLAYTATIGTLTLLDQSGEKSAAIVYTAYVLKDAERERRPLTFVFNGGPGASSAYLHLGLAGPQVAVFGPKADGAEARLEANPDTWLAFTDLVMIDPVGAGWSRAAKPDGANAFWGVQPDAQSLAKAVALYVAHNQRGASPKYLLGESYGGFRAVKVARTLQQEQGIVVRGIVMLSPFLEGAFTFGSGRSALTAALQLPSMAAADLDRRNAFKPEALAAAERFAMTDYLVTLAGRPPEGEAGRRFYARVAELTGLPADVVARTRGFVRDAYQKETLAGRREVLSAYDGAFAVPDPFPESASAEGADPILDGHLQALGGLFVGYARDKLGFKTEMTFQLLNREVSGKWDWGRGRTQAGASRDMRELLALNPGFKMFVAHGRSDLVTPYGVSRYILDHLPEFGGDRARLATYKGGHMFYFDKEARAAFTADVRGFYEGRE